MHQPGLEIRDLLRLEVEIENLVQLSLLSVTDYAVGTDNRKKQCSDAAVEITPPVASQPGQVRDLG